MKISFAWSWSRTSTTGEALPNCRTTSIGRRSTELRDICKRGVEEGVIRADIDPLDLHMSISALCFFNVSNRYTFSTIFNVDMVSPKAAARRRKQVTEMVLRYVAP